MKLSQTAFFSIAVLGVILLFPALGICSVETTLDAVRDKLIGRILPVVGTLGLCFAGFSFFTGNPNARSHLILACIGAFISFGAVSIINFIQSLVH